MAIWRGLLIIPMFLASVAEAYGIEVLSQRFELSTVAQVVPVQGPYQSEERDSRINQGIGDRMVRSEARTSQDGAIAFAEMEATLRRTNIVGGETFWLESDLAIGSEDLLVTVETQIVTRASAAMSLDLQVHSATAFQYHVVKSGEASPTAPGGGGFSIRSAYGVAILEINWGHNDSSNESQGSLPPGTYTIRFFNSSSADGIVSPTLVNHISGRGHTSVAVTFRPGGSVPQSAPTLKLSRGARNSVMLEMTNLQPGTNYTIERAEAIDAQFWEYVTNFSSGGTEATWTDLMRENTQSTFYRIRF